MKFFGFSYYDSLVHCRFMRQNVWTDHAKNANLNSEVYDMVDAGIFHRWRAEEQDKRRESN